MKAHPVDIHVGKRMRQRRTLLGMSQTKLGDAVGITFQQVQKNERGFNRMGSSRLFQFAKLLDVPVSYFFDEMPKDIENAKVGSGKKITFDPTFMGGKDPLIKRETLELVRDYYKIRDPKVRKRIFEMVKAVGTASASAGSKKK